MLTQSFLRNNLRLHCDNFQVNLKTTEYSPHKHEMQSYFLAIVETRILLCVLECWYWVTNWITPLPPWGIGALCCKQKHTRH